MNWIYISVWCAVSLVDTYCWYFLCREEIFKPQLERMQRNRYCFLLDQFSSSVPIIDLRIIDDLRFFDENEKFPFFEWWRGGRQTASLLRLSKEKGRKTQSFPIYVYPNCKLKFFCRERSQPRESDPSILEPSNPTWLTVLLTVMNPKIIEGGRATVSTTPVSCCAHRSHLMFIQWTTPARTHGITFGY